MKRTTEQKIAEIEGRLARLRNSRRLEQKRLQGDRRRADAHRKIELGGLLIACGVDDLNPGEIAGLLLSWKAQREAKPEQVSRLLEAGIKHLADRAKPASAGSAGS
jgi:hypothetical protein